MKNIIISLFTVTVLTGSIASLILLGNSIKNNPMHQYYTDGKGSEVFYSLPEKKNSLPVSKYNFTQKFSESETILPKLSDNLNYSNIKSGRNGAYTNIVTPSAVISSVNQKTKTTTSSSIGSGSMLAVAYSRNNSSNEESYGGAAYTRSYILPHSLNTINLLSNPANDGLATGSGSISPGDAGVSANLREISVNDSISFLLFLIAIFGLVKVGKNTI